jgi:arginine repressor
MVSGMNKHELLKELKFESTTELIKYLQDHKYIFKVDATTGKDIYTLEKGEYRDKSYHYEIAEKNNFIILQKVD